MEEKLDLRNVANLSMGTLQIKKRKDWKAKSDVRVADHLQNIIPPLIHRLAPYAISGIMQYAGARHELSNVPILFRLWNDCSLHKCKYIATVQENLIGPISYAISEDMQYVIYHTMKCNTCRTCPTRLISDREG